MPIYQLEAKLGGQLLDSAPIELTTATLRVRFYDIDSPSTQRTPDPSTLLFEMDALNTQGKTSEYILCDSHSTTDGITTLVNVQRGLPRDATFPIVSDINLVNSWDVGTPIGCATNHYNDNEIARIFGGSGDLAGPLTITGDLTVNGNTNLQTTTVTDTINFTDGTVTARRDGAGNLLFADNATAEVSLSTLAAAAGADTQVRISLADTTNGFLNDKAVAGNGVTTTILNPGANESLSLSLDLDPAGGLTFNGTSLAISSLVAGSSAEAPAANSTVFENTDDPNNLAFKDSTGTVHRIIDQANLDTQVNQATGSGTFAPAAAGNTVVIPHGLGRIPNNVHIKWGVQTPNSGFFTGNGEVYYDGTTQSAMSFVSNSAGNANWTGSFSVDGLSGAGIAWSGDVTFDATNITIEASTFTSAATIVFVWKAV